MPLKLHPSGLGSGIDKDRPHLPDPRRSRQSALVLVDERKRPHDTIGPGGDLGRGEGAVSEELGRMEGVGEVNTTPRL